MTNKIQIRNGDYSGGSLYATIEQIQDVWAAISKEPMATINELVQTTQITRQKVFHILRWLQACGYVEHNHGYRCRKVIIPVDIQ